jgi:hypothetical protein
MAVRDEERIAPADGEPFGIGRIAEGRA